VLSVNLVSLVPISYRSLHPLVLCRVLVGIAVMVTVLVIDFGLARAYSNSSRLESNWACGEKQITTRDGTYLLTS
jgi:hypothetical protein